jgi:hypothetical protein
VWLDDPVVAKNKRINVLNHLENSLMYGLLIKYLLLTKGCLEAGKSDIKPV